MPPAPSGQGRATGPALQPDDGPGVGRGETVTVPAEQVGQDGRLVQAAGAPLPQVDLLEGDDVGVDVADLVGQGGTRSRGGYNRRKPNKPAGNA